MATPEPERGADPGERLGDRGPRDQQLGQREGADQRRRDGDPGDHDERHHQPDVLDEQQRDAEHRQQDQDDGQPVPQRLAPVHGAPADPAGHRPHGEARDQHAGQRHGVLLVTALLAATLDGASVEERTDPGLIKEKIRVDLQRFFRKRSRLRPLVAAGGDGDLTWPEPPCPVASASSRA